MRKIILESDMQGEERYIIGAVSVPDNESTAIFSQKAVNICDEVRYNTNEWTDEDILAAFIKAGYEVVECPEIITVIK